MMTRDINRDFFLPLRWFRYEPNPYFFDKEQIQLAEKLAEYYDLPPGNMMRLISYAEKALEWALKSEQMFSVDDWSELLQFEEQPEPIRKVTFHGKTKSFTIRNPYLIDILYQTTFGALKDIPSFGDDLAGSPVEALLSQNPQDSKRRPSNHLIKLIGTEIYNDLINYNDISKWRAECILVQILSLYHIGLKVNKPLMTERQHNDYNSERKAKNMTIESYLSYCRGQGKNYHY